MRYPFFRPIPGNDAGASRSGRDSWFRGHLPAPLIGKTHFRGIRLTLTFRRNARPLSAIGLVLCCGLALTACSSGGIGDLFDGGGNKVTGGPVTGKIEAPEVQTLKGSSSIAVLVNEDPITNFDIAQRRKLMALGGAKATTKAATDELIDETLQLYEARKRGLNVSSAQVDDAYASIAQGMKLSPKQLTGALNSQGVESVTLKNRLRAQITWQYLVQRRTQATVAVKRDDIASALAEKGDPSKMTLTEFMLQQIVFIVPDGSSNAFKTQRRREAEAFRQRFKGCDNSLEQAKQLKGVVVKNIGRRDSTQLQGDLGEQIKKTPAGKVAPPSTIEQGIELIAVCSTKEIHSTAAARAEVTNSLYLKQANDLGKDYMAELRKAAIIEYR